MPVITQSFKEQVLQDIFDDYNDSASNNYFIGIGRSEGWGDSADTAIVPKTRLRDERGFRASLQSVKTVQDVSYVVNRRQWATGLIYYAYDDNDVGYNPDQPFYVMNSNQEVYICLRQGKTADGRARASDVQPTGNTTGTPFTLSDGYTWKFLYSIGALRASKFLSSAYMPVKLVTSTDSDSPAEDLQQETVQNNAVDGQVVGYHVTEGGSGYNASNPPNVTVVGDGINATAYAVVSGEEVVEVRVKEDSSGNLGSSYYGQDYTFANLVFTGGGGSGASGRAIMAPEGGMGSDPRKALRSSAIMFNAKIDGDEDSDFTIGADIYRQVGLLKNIRVSEDSAGGQSALFDEATGIGLNRITHNGSGWSSEAILKETVTGSTSGAQAYIDKVNAANNAFWYHQTEETGFKDFQSGEEITIGDLSATITSIDEGDFSVKTGEILYIDNRSPVNRLTDQEDDLKVVITL
jgi:hypothetical protein